MRAFWLSLVLLAAPVALSGQWLDKDRVWDADQWQHFAAGAVLDVGLRGLPVIAPDWRRSPAKRLALVGGLAVIFEVYQVYESSAAGWLGNEGAGFGLLDLLATMCGALSAELLTSALGKVL